MLDCHYSSTKWISLAHEIAIDVCHVQLNFIRQESLEHATSCIQYCQHRISVKYGT